MSDPTNVLTLQYNQGYFRKPHSKSCW